MQERGTHEVLRVSAEDKIRNRVQFLREVRES